MSKGGFNFKEFQQFRNNFDKLYKDFNQWIHDYMMSEGLRFIAKVKPRTPVDTGDLRNHWQLDSITREGDVYHCWFVNPMEYATFVEYGHAKPYKSGAGPGSPDWVEGYFMMTVSIEDVQREMPARFNKAFQQYLQGLGLM